jgi:fructokinase
VEGMVNSDSIAARKGITREALASIPDDDEVWDIVSHYVAHLCATLTYIVSPEVIVLGGGIMKRPCILPMVREKLLKLLNGYIQSEKILKHIDNYVVRSTFETESGLVGALTLAKIAHKSH